MPDPNLQRSVILSYGLSRLHLYPESEYLACLKRAFVYHSADFITLDSNPYGQGFTSAAAAWGVREGYLRVAKVAEGDQEQVTELRLTEEGKNKLEEK